MPSSSTLKHSPSHDPSPAENTCVAGSSGSDGNYVQLSSQPAAPKGQWPQPSSTFGPYYCQPHYNPMHNDQYPPPSQLLPGSSYPGSSGNQPSVPSQIPYYYMPPSYFMPMQVGYTMDNSRFLYPTMPNIAYGTNGYQVSSTLPTAPVDAIGATPKASSKTHIPSHDSATPAQPVPCIPSGSVEGERPSAGDLPTENSIVPAVQKDTEPSKNGKVAIPISSAVDGQETRTWTVDDIKALLAKAGPYAPVNDSDVEIIEKACLHLEHSLATVQCLTDRLAVAEDRYTWLAARDRERSISLKLALRRLQRMRVGLMQQRLWRMPPASKLQ
ncbi:hypothetical protein EW146_g10329 [Bondarzewia mesenterica]|uniref:Uncharacterized protein n=1 Tax=Bondarzewia mesenterica TaxID=1095465 RepID=A0A4S4KY57_9AGAM|nr:hypothetical protein EW146_g10329 [Bondarzewia mesenterica]